MLKALGHPVRLGMIKQLLEKHCCCCGELCDCFNHSQSTVSQHLSVLKDAGLLRAERDGTRMLYSVEPDALELLTNAIANLGNARAPADEK